MLAVRGGARGTQLDSGDGRYLRVLSAKANVSFVDCLDAKPKPTEETSPKQDATPAQPGAENTEIPSEVADLVADSNQQPTDYESAHRGWFQTLATG